MMRVWMPVRLVPAHGVGGGMEVAAWTTAEHLVAQGHEVTVVTTAHPDGRPEEVTGGVRVRYVPGTTWRRYQRRWWEASYDLLRSQGADVVLSQSAGGLGYLRRAREELGVPSAVVLYGSARRELTTAWRGATSPRGLYRLARLSVRVPRQVRAWRAAAPSVSRWLPVSDEVGADNLRELRIPARHVTVVPSGVDTERFRPDPAARRATRAALGIDPSAPVVALATRLEREKGVDVALGAVHLLRSSHPDLRVVVAGAGHDEARLRNRAARSGIADRCSFLGLVQHDRLPATLAAADLFLFCSRCAEGRPVSVLEASAAGLPVVETDGVRIRRGDAAGLASAVAALLDDQPARRRLGAEARERAVGEWSIKAMVDTLERVLAGLVVACPNRR